MARNQVFQSDGDASTRVTLIFDDAADPADTGWELDFVDAADNITSSNKLTTQIIAKLKSATKGDATGVVELGKAPTRYWAVGRSNASSFNVLEGDSSEEAFLDEAKTMSIIAHITLGYTTP